MGVIIFMLPLAGTSPDSLAVGYYVAADGPTTDAFTIHYGNNLGCEVEVVDQPLDTV